MNKWRDVLHDQTTCDYYKNLQTFLAKEYNEATIYPKQADIFNALTYTDYDDVKGRIRVADISGHKLVTAMIRVRCSKGTYIRALARDLGEAMGSGAFLSSLRRTKNGDFNIEDAISLDKVMELFSENL